MRPYLRESLEGITVHRAPLYVSHDSDAKRRAVNYLSFAASASVVAATRLGRVDVALVHSTPATVAIPAMARRLFRRTPFVLHIQDLWPDTVTASGFLSEGRHDSVERVLHRFCDRTYAAAAHVAVTSPGMAERIIGRGVPAKKVSVVPNWADERRFYPAHATDVTTASVGPLFPFTVMYAGTMGDVQALDTVVDAAVLLRDSTEIGFVLVGGGAAEESLRGRVSQLGLSNVRFVPPQPAENMAEVLALGDVQVISLRDTPTFRATLPSKIQATMAAGRPIVCAVAGDAGELVRIAGAGLTVAPESGAELATAIRTIAALTPEQRGEMGMNGLRYYQQELSEEHGARALESVLRRAAEGRAQS